MTSVPCLCRYEEEIKVFKKWYLARVRLAGFFVCTPHLLDLQRIVRMFAPLQHAVGLRDKSHITEILRLANREIDWLIQSLNGTNQGRLTFEGAKETRGSDQITINDEVVALILQVGG